MTIKHWRDIAWQIPLSSPPEVVQIGTSVHGYDPVERYTMLGIWCLHLYRYEAIVTVDGVDFPIAPGHAGVIPPNTPMAYRYQGRSPHLYVHFRCAEFASKPAEIPAMQDLGDHFGRIYELMSEVVTRQDAYAQARLWDVLWQLSELRNPDGFAGDNLHPVVRKTVQYIEKHLSETIKVAALAEKAGVSTSHLSRLFQDAFQTSVITSMRERRVRRAVHLLQKSTIPIKTIAVMVGIPDLQHFNRTLHKSLGMSPTEARARLSDVPPEPDAD